MGHGNSELSTQECLCISVRRRGNPWQNHVLQGLDTKQMTTILAQIAPQRSTQYMALSSALAPHELELSPIGPHITSMVPIEMADQAYLKLTMDTLPDDDQIKELGMLAMTKSFFQYYERLGEHEGPFLRPIEAHFSPTLPYDLVMTRRYQGKTNESFTHFMCNIARFSSDFSGLPWNQLRIFDPLAGGGTTLFMALVLGANAAGVEKNTKNTHSTAVFLKQYTKEQGIACAIKEERLKKLKGKRWRFTIGTETTQECILARGDTAQSEKLIAGFRKPHLIVCDLPYGIQHQGKLKALLAEALPVWASLLQPGGAMAMAWESTRFPRTDMIALIESESPLHVLNHPPYNMLTHQVDRVIKQRDVIVAVTTA